MAESSVATDVHQSLDVHRDFPAQVALDSHLFVHNLTNAVDLIVGQITDSRIWIYIRALEKLLAGMQPDSEDVRQRCLDTLFTGEVNSRNSCHVLSPLRVEKPE